MRNQDAGARVVQQIGQLVALGQRVDGHENRAAFQRGPQADDSLHAVVKEGGHAVTLLHATLLERSRQTVSLQIDVGIAQTLGFKHQSFLMRRSRCGALQQVMQQHAQRPRV